MRYMIPAWMPNGGKPAGPDAPWPIWETTRFDWPEPREEVAHLFGQPIRVIVDPLCPPTELRCGELRIVNLKPETTR